MRVLVSDSPHYTVKLRNNPLVHKYLTLKTKWSDMARDYGNGNRTYSDERIDDYLVSDLLIKYNLQNSYDLFLNITNILDEKYETTRDYSQMDRALNFGIKSSY